MNEYNDVNMLNSLIQKNIRYGVSIKEDVYKRQAIAPSEFMSLFLRHTTRRKEGLRKVLDDKKCWGQ